MRNTFEIVVLLSGRGSNFRALNEALTKLTIPVRIAAVISDRSTAPGLDYASEQGIPTRIVPRRAKERSVEDFETELLSVVQSFSPHLVVLAGFMRILSASFIDRCSATIINIHPSLLPAFRGIDAQQQALNAGVKFAGCTVHVVTADLDAGPILAQAVVPVVPGDTRDTLADRILVQEHSVLPAVVAGIADGSIRIDRDANGAIKVSSLHSSSKPATGFECALCSVRPVQ